MTLAEKAPELDHAWAVSLARVMVTNDHPRGVANLCRCYLAMREDLAERVLGPINEDGQQS